MSLARLEPRTGDGRVGHAAADEHLAHDEPDPELALEGEDVGDGAGRDVESGGHARRTLGPGEDGIGAEAAPRCGHVIARREIPA